MKEEQIERLRARVAYYKRLSIAAAKAAGDRSVENTELKKELILLKARVENLEKQAAKNSLD